MHRVPIAISVLFAVAAAAALAYAWQLREALAAAELRHQDLSAEIRRLKENFPAVPIPSRPGAGGPGPGALPTEGSNPPPAPDGEGPGRGDRGPDARNRRAAMMQTPEMQRLMQLERREGLDHRYGALFRKLKLAPGDLDRLKDLLVERESVAGDVYEAARSLGMNFRDNRAQIQKQVADAQAAIDASIQSAFGAGVLQQFQDYEATSTQRSLVGSIERRLSYTPNPLNLEQSERLVGLLSAASPTPPAPAGPGPGGPNSSRGFSAMSDAVLAQSRSFLSDAQVETLRQMRDESLQREQLRQQMQAKAQALRDAAGAGPTATKAGP